MLTFTVLNPHYTYNYTYVAYYATTFYFIGIQVQLDKGRIRKCMAIYNGCIIYKQFF